jgi:hypothetical protein
MVLQPQKMPTKKSQKKPTKKRQLKNVNQKMPSAPRTHYFLLLTYL